MRRTSSYKQLHNQCGAVGLMVTLLVPFFIGVAALAIDVTHRVVLSNELQNAADAGALAGAARLYTADGTMIDTGANQIAQEMAWQNLTTRVPQTTGESNRLAPEVVADLAANGGDVQRGHWAFGPPVQSNLARGFYPNASTATVDLFGVTSADLDANVNFINAVRVITRREGTPIVTFFARIFGVTDTQLSREAVAYIGFAGRLNPEEVDQPIAICRESITNGDEYNCNIGRMLNSGSNNVDHNTGGWTDFNQESNPCQGGTNTSLLRPLICANGNPYTIFLGRDMATNGGVIQNIFDDFKDCWDDNTIIADLDSTELDEWCGTGTVIDYLANQLANPAAIVDSPDLIRRTWGMTLPVITCPSNNIGTCERVVGAVDVDVAWINRTANQNQFTGNPGVPKALFGPDCNILWDGSNMPDGDRVDREAVWNSFRDTLPLENVDNIPAHYADKSIYFLPSCDVHEPTGVSGGENFGILAKIPVLVCPDPASHNPSDTNNCLGGQ